MKPRLNAEIQLYRQKTFQACEHNIRSVESVENGCAESFRRPKQVFKDFRLPKYEQSAAVIKPTAKPALLLINDGSL